jgi:hypothetical protein
MQLSKFKASNGKYFTRQLFWEQFIELPLESRTREPLFSLYNDKPGMINFGKTYVRLADPSGYKVAQEVLDGDYTLWTVLTGCRWFIQAKELWDRELDAKLFSEGMDEIRLLAKEGMPAQKLAASKYLANKEYKKDRTQSKGRPKREEIDRAAKALADSERDLDEDLKRIRGTN